MSLDSGVGFISPLFVADCSQNLVSSSSFCAIRILWMKSFRLSGFWASLMLAPTEVPLLDNCTAISWYPNSTNFFRHFNVSIASRRLNSRTFKFCIIFSLDPKIETRVLHKKGINYTSLCERSELLFKTRARARYTPKGSEAPRRVHTRSSALHP